MADRFPMDVGLALDLKNAFHRNGWEGAEEVKRLATGDVLRGVRQLVLGRAEIVPAPITPPDGGRIHVVHLPVDGECEWREIVLAGCPQTAKDSAVYRVGGQYPPEGRSGLREVVLANFGPRSLTLGPAAVTWAEKQNLRPEGPRAVFTIAQFRPFLNLELGMGAIAVVATQTCSFEGGRHAPCAWWRDAERRANLYGFVHGWHDSFWFAFVRGFGPEILGS